jgi:hypothetical protein
MDYYWSMRSTYQLFTRSPSPESLCSAKDLLVDTQANTESCSDLSQMITATTGLD